MVENNKIIIYLLYMYKGENLSNFCNRNPGTGTDAERPCRSGVCCGKCNPMNCTLDKTILVCYNLGRLERVLHTVFSGKDSMGMESTAAAAFLSCMWFPFQPCGKVSEVKLH